jgi:transposase
VAVQRIGGSGLPVICVETRHMKAALSAQINKSDRNDARGIAQMMHVSARLVIARREPQLDRITTDGKDNRNGRGCGFGR